MNRFVAITCLLCLASIACSQWTRNPSSPFVACNRANDQVQPKLKPTADGGCYLAWYDNETGGYDVYLQRLDKNGNELWPHNGVLIANRGLSSTQDYGIDVDSNQNCLISFNDDRFGNAICVNKVSPAGVLLWGPNGAQMPSANFLGPPHVASLSDGFIGVGYSVDNTYAYSRLNSAGGVTGTWSFSETGKPYALSDIVASNNGSVIILYIRRFNSTGSSAKALWAQKYDVNGQTLWAAPVPIYAPTGSPYGSQGGSIQNGNFPSLISDGSGGAVCAFYETGGPRNALAQHVDVNGALRFPVHGAPNAVTSASFIRIEAFAAYDKVTDSVYMASVEANSVQNAWRVFVQKFGPVGQRLWGETGLTIIPSNANQPSFVQCQTTTDGMSVFGFDARSATTGIVFAAGVTSDGNALWGTTSTSYVSDINAGKGRLASINSTKCFHVLAWQNVGNGSTDIHANRLNADGFLGNHDEVLPDSFTVIEGTAFGGGLAEVLLSDNLRATTFSDDSTLGCTVQLTGTLLHPNPIVMYVSIETNATRPGLSEVVSVLNVTTSEFNDLLGIEASLSDRFRCLTVFTPTLYASPSGVVTMRIRWAPINDEDPSQDGWLLAVDQVHIEAR